MQELYAFFRDLIPRGMDFLLSVLLALLILIVGMKIVKKLLAILKKSLLKKEVEPGLVSFLISTGKILLNLLIIITAAQVLGFATTSVVALLGSAGLAIGLALQGSLANFAGGVLLLTMKPFVVGDYIIAGDVEGTVKKIDVVYTTLQTGDNRVVILPNGKLADSNIINATKEEKRRVDLEIGIGYSEDIKRVRSVLKKIADSHEELLPDMPLDIMVSSLDDSAVTMAVRVWVRPESYWKTRSEMLEEIKEVFEKEGIEIPYNKLDVNVNTIANL